MTDPTSGATPADSRAPGPDSPPRLGLVATPLSSEDRAVARARAFGRLSDSEREELLRHIAEQLPPAERALAGPANAHPLGLARLLQRLESRDPGLLHRVLTGMGTGSRVGKAWLGGLGVGLVGGLVGGATAAAVLTGPTGVEEADAATEAGWLESLLDAGGLDGF